jgi:diguanylate cyclase (GGDEF)-like protein/PAS domain S-box-containing protein
MTQQKRPRQLRLLVPLLILLTILFSGGALAYVLLPDQTGWYLLLALGLVNAGFLTFMSIYAWRLQLQLEQTFDQLTEENRLRSTAENKLKIHLNTLEGIIAERTQSLAESNQALKLDIIQREKTEQALRESEQKYRALFNGSQDLILVLRQGKIIDANQAARQALGISRDAQLSTTSLDSCLTNPALPKTLSYQWLKQAQQDGVWQAEMEFHSAGLTAPVETAINAISEAGEMLFLVTCRDITERRRAQAELEYLANFDALTGLPNRHRFADRLQAAIQSCRRHQEKGAVLFIDLDHFKNINDSLGHGVGDLLLKAVAERLKDHLRAEDTAFRFGGDEFVIILSRAGNGPDSAALCAQSVADKLLASLGAAYALDGHEVYVTPSIGITLFPKLNETAEDIVKQADAALYIAKDHGRNTARFFDPNMQEATETRLLLEKELRGALDKKQLFLTLQTKHANDGSLAGTECLLRWRHPELGLVSPLEFIGIAEETRQIIPIGLWVIEEAAQWIRTCQQEKLPTGCQKVAINLSPIQLYQPQFVQNLWSIFHRHQLDPGLVTLEITENVLIRDINETIRILGKLKDLGFAISIDDFGTGYSSLKYLKRLPLDELKIDQSFVRDLHTDQNDKAIVETIVSMARHLSLGIVAEGVETPEQLAFLSEIGCHRFQGYYFARPTPLPELLNRFRP